MRITGCFCGYLFDLQSVWLDILLSGLALTPHTPTTACQLSFFHSNALTPSCWGSLGSGGTENHFKRDHVCFLKHVHHLITALHAKGASKKMMTQLRSHNSAVVAAPHKVNRRNRIVIFSYAPNAAAGVRCIAPSSSMHDSEHAIKTLGQVCWLHAD